MVRDEFSQVFALMLAVQFIIAGAAPVKEVGKSETKVTQLATTGLKEDFTATRAEVEKHKQLNENGKRGHFTKAWGESVNTVSESSNRLLSGSGAVASKGGTSGARDCTELRRQGHSQSGVYTIHPYFGRHFQVFCDMDSDGGGWTVLQMRNSGYLNFERSWEDYASGLGSPFAEQWLGLETLHILTYYQKQASELRIDLWDQEGNHTHAQYKGFWIDSETDSYRIHLSGYNSGSTESDIMRDCNEMKFSTPDRDNDNSYSTNCAYHQQSGWWFNHCSLGTNLNAPYFLSSLAVTPDNKQQMNRSGKSYRRVEMKFRTPLLTLHH